MARKARQSSKLKISDNEPRWNKSGDESQLAQMLTWYNYNKNEEDAKQYFMDFLKTSGEAPDVLSKIERCSSIPLSNTIGWMCRIMIVNGNLVPGKYTENIAREKTKVLQVVLADDAPKSTQEEVVKRPGVQEHLENQLREVLGELSFQWDEFIRSGLSKTFDVYSWLQTNNVKHQHAKSIADYFDKSLLSELQEARDGKCEQLSEAYSFLKKSDMKKAIAFAQSLVDESRKWSDVAKQISLNNRSHRVKKPKPALKQVAKLKYQKESGELKSVPPTQIVGATQLWVYNTKYRTLGVYVCNNAHGFSVKGCTILNFDASESICKKLRKPEDVIPKVLDSGKVALRKILPDIRSKDKKLTGRINADTILLKAL